MSRRLLVLCAAATSAVLFVVGCASTEPTAVAPRTDYAGIARELTRVIEHERVAKGLPALSIALVDDQEIVWAQGFGFADPEQNTPATARTMYRVGSISKLFTDIGVMQLVEKGELDLDAPVTRYLPDFRPDGSRETGITLRQLTGHRAGLVREPPIGSYFDDTEPTLATVAASLDGTGLIHQPGTRTKYSNAGIAVVGRVLEVTQNAPFAEYLKASVLDPIGLVDCGFESTAEIRRRLAQASMWAYDRPPFPAPTFELGMAPAGSLYATVLDLGRFVSYCLRPNPMLQKMMTPQASEDGRGFGIGFVIDTFEGKKRCGHGGAIYGFSSQLEFLPNERLGVIAASSLDVSNGIVGRITDYALRHMLALRGDAPPARWEFTQKPDPTLAKRIAGTYRAGDQQIVLHRHHDGRLLADAFGLRREVRARGDTLVLDDCLRGATPELKVEPNAIRIGSTTYRRVESGAPPPAPERWRDLIGEYGWDHNVLFVHERDGHLCALVEWIFFDRLRERSADVFAFPESSGLYHGETLSFDSDAKGKVTAARIGKLVFRRREVGTKEGETFRITPVAPMAELRAQAMAASPPKESRPKGPDLVDIAAVDATIRLDIRYATTNNFMSAVFYKQPRAFAQRPAARALRRAHERLRRPGYGLLVHDAYRPWFVTKMFWDATPQSMKHFVADPSKGSRHNRGSAVDVTLYELDSGKVVPMVGGYDEFSARSYPAYPGGTSRQRWHRELLRHVMEECAFSVYEFEWWHYDYVDWRDYPILNLTFEELGR